MAHNSDINNSESDKDFNLRQEADQQTGKDILDKNLKSSKIQRFGSLGFILAVGIFLIYFSYISIMHSNEILLHFDRSEVIFLDHINDTILETQKTSNMTLKEIEMNRESSKKLIHVILVNINDTQKDLDELKKLITELH